ncbi:MAG: DUF6370 family protein [Phycisphaerales bacterium]
MKTLCFLSLGAVLALGGCSQTPTTETAATTEVVSLRSETVEVACGSCVYGMDGVKGCKLAVKINNGDPILATGSDLDLHKHNLCSSPSQAVVTGEVEGDTLVVTSVEIK